MDTRNKIVEPATILRDGRPLTVIIGFFDPLHAWHIQRFLQHCQTGSRTAVIVDDPEDPLLPARARAELVASLGCVDYVLTGSDALISAIQPDSVIDERAADAESRQELMRRVVSRHVTA